MTEHTTYWTYTVRYNTLSVSWGRKWRRKHCIERRRQETKVAKVKQKRGGLFALGAGSALHSGGIVGGLRV